MIHVAGTFDGLVQRCARCNALLNDYRHAMYPEGDPAPAGWHEGAHIEVLEGNPRAFYVTNAPADCETRQ